MPRAFRLFGILVVLCGLAGMPARAQEEPPARVGRVALVTGTLAFHMPGETSWSAAGVNYPVASGGAFWTDPQSRAQFRIGPTTIALAGGSELDVTRLDQQITRLDVPQGRIWLHIRDLGEGGSVEIDIPQGAAWLLQPGEYEIDAGGEGRPARLAVFAGAARFVSGGTVVGVEAGRMALLAGGNPVTAEIVPAAADEFVAWARAHDYREDRLAAPRYISPHMSGYAELDQYGSWAGTPDYGEVWYPNAMPAGWAPYRFGHWVWIAPWGWTWIDREPWGFAPFHYGRWALIGGRWGWVPGRLVRHPVYAPALVAFLGGVSVSARIGPTVGWFPLAPGEIYWPSYTRNANYIRQINTADVRDIGRIAIRPGGLPPRQGPEARFVNRQHATVVPRQVFANARPVAAAAISVPQAALRRAPVMVHPPQIRPAAARPGPAAAPLRPPAQPGPAGGQIRPPSPPPSRGSVTVLPPHPGRPNRLHPAPPAAQRQERGPQVRSPGPQHAPAALPAPRSRPGERAGPPAVVSPQRPSERPGSPAAVRPRPTGRETPPRPGAAPQSRTERHAPPAVVHPRAPERAPAGAVHPQRFEAPHGQPRPAPSVRRATPAPAPSPAQPARHARPGGQAGPPRPASPPGHGRPPGERTQPERAGPGG